jgi:hypothetical protein
VRPNAEPVDSCTTSAPAVQPVVTPPRENLDLLFTDLYTSSRIINNNFAQPSSVLSPKGLDMLGMDTHEHHLDYVHDSRFFEPFDTYEINIDFNNGLGINASVRQCLRQLNTR